MGIRAPKGLSMGFLHLALLSLSFAWARSNLRRFPRYQMSPIVNWCTKSSPNCTAFASDLVPTRHAFETFQARLAKEAEKGGNHS
jgi:hypothetical protein